ncbi:MAG: BatA and WFA domain-containing protein [Bythopirellula sp.]|nr:BatA and WFA domain-containing protein [Bythopirellula sp.]
MGFLTPALLAGIGLIAVPIILHLVMRRQPKQFSFPALQFVKQRQDANRRKLNFRHLLLLALRCLLIAGIAFALARPTLRGSGLRGKEGAPLAVALVFDNSLRMQYIERNETRLISATTMAESLVEKLPDDTEIAVIDLSRATSSFAADKGTAEMRIRGLAAESHPRSLAEAVRNAIDLVAEQEDRRQEVFVFSDLSADSFNEESLAAIKESLEASPDVRIYVVDVGSDEPRNLSLAPVTMRTSSLRTGESLNLTVDLQSVGYAEQPLVEIFLEDATGKLVKRGQRIVELNAEGTGQTEFTLGDLPLGTHQGAVQLAASDPLEFDNRRYFTVEVRPAAKVLLLGGSVDGESGASDALFLKEALSPSLMGPNAPQRFETTVARFADAAKLNLSDFEAVCLLDPPPLSDEVWNKLADYARKGGGVGMFLGHRAVPSGFNTEPPQQLLPGTLKLRSRQETWFRPQQLDHPALVGLRNYAEEIPWQIYPVWSFWEFDELAGDAYIVAKYANNRPALIERPLGRGRVMTFTTPFSDPLAPVGRDSWNALPTQDPPWVFVAIANQLVGYLAQSEAGELNFNAGETVNLRLSPRQQVTDFVLKEPTGEALRRTLPPGEDAIRIGTTEQLGNYRVAAGGSTGSLDEGFSVNALAELSQLTRADPQAIMAALPKERVQLAESLGDVEQYVNIGRRGQELFSWVIALVALVWSSEHLLANRFYRGERQP